MNPEMQSIEGGFMAFLMDFSCYKTHEKPGR